MNLSFTNTKYRPDIDGLRALAVLSVVWFHAFPKDLKGGFIGVDIFFVISGFLITGIILDSFEKNSFSLSEFYARRIRRIFPALILVLVVCHIAGWFFLLADEYAQLGKHVLGGATFASNLFLWGEVGYFDKSAENKPLLHLWSLGVEEQFYVFWPISLWFAWKRKLSILAIVTSLGLASLMLNLWLVNLDPTADFYSPVTRLWELLCGAALATINTHSKGHLTNSIPWNYGFFNRNFFSSKSETYSNLSSIVGLVILIYGFTQIPRDSAFPGAWAIIPVVGSAMIIAAGPNSWINRHIFASKLAVWFGLISFPLYLWHWPLLSFLRLIKSYEPSRGHRNIVIVIAVFLAWLTFKAVEKPFRYGASQNRKVFLLVTAITVCGLTGWFTFYSAGFPGRGWLKNTETTNYDFSFDQKLGRPKEATVMLIGDSHAGHLAPGIQKIFGNKIADYSHNGCIPFLDVDRFDRRGKPGECVKAINEGLKILLTDPKFTGVIMSSMGPVYLTNHAFKNMDKDRVTGAGVKLISNPAIVDPWEIYEISMRNTLTQLRNSGKKVLFILDIPELGYEPLDCYGRPTFFEPIAKNSCSLLRTEYEIRTNQYKTIIKKILKDYPEVDFYDPTNDFCDEKTCKDMVDGVLLYRNTDHLGNNGSIYLVQKMKKNIEKLF